MWFVRALGTAAFAFLARTACCHIGPASTIERLGERNMNVEEQISIPAITLACTITGLHDAFKLVVVVVVMGLFRGRWCFICIQV